jgi:hypothetical protein
VLFGGVHGRVPARPTVTALSQWYVPVGTGPVDALPGVIVVVAHAIIR